MENEKQNLIKSIELNFDLNLKFNDEHALKQYKFKHCSLNIILFVRDITIAYKQELYRLAEYFDLKGDLDSIRQAKSKCRKFVNKYGSQPELFHKDIFRISRKLEKLELKIIWFFLPEGIRKQYFRMFIDGIHRDSAKHKLFRELLVDELFY